MIVWLIVSAIFNIAFVTLLVIISRNFLKLIAKHENTRDVLEESLDRINGDYETICIISGKEVISDEPNVRNIVAAITRIKFTLLDVVKRITDEFGVENVPNDKVK
jgi:hypothetical protein